MVFIYTAEEAKDNLTPSTGDADVTKRTFSGEKLS
jgi:hypothetical protein